MADTAQVDFIVIGAGMAGATVAAELAGGARVALIETEDQPGRHTTGRSAAMYFESYGNPVVRALTRASRDFLASPPPDVAERPLIEPREGLMIADEDGSGRLARLLDTEPATGCLRRITPAEALARCPILRPDGVAAAIVDTSGHDIDVAALHQGVLRRFRHRGGQLALDAGTASIRHTGRGWTVTGRGGRWQAPVVVNAAGAWADAVAVQAGLPPIGLQPKRRSAVVLPAPEGHDVRAWPMVCDAHETCYFKPDAGQLMLSPANEDDSPPCDAAPEELEVAMAAHRFEELTTVPVRRILHRWAGLRTFAPDRSPVVGFDPVASGFFWFAGQGGYGIQMAPALARAGAALARGQALPADIVAQGAHAAALSPARFRTAS